MTAPSNKRILKPCNPYCLLTPYISLSLPGLLSPQLSLTFNMSCTSVAAAKHIAFANDASVFRLGDDILLQILAQLSADDLVLLRKVRVTMYTVSFALADTTPRLANISTSSLVRDTFGTIYSGETSHKNANRFLHIASPSMSSGPHNWKLSSVEHNASMLLASSPPSRSLVANSPCSGFDLSRANGCLSRRRTSSKVP